MPSLDIFQFVERFFAALTGFVYSAGGSLALLARHPHRGPAILARRFTADGPNQAGPLTLVFIVLVAVFAGFQMSESGRGAYADFDGGDMVRRLVPGWNGHLTPELGAVVLSAFLGAAVTDTWARIMVTCGWPDFARGFPARLHRRHFRQRLVTTRYFMILPLALTGLSIAAVFGVPAALGLELMLWTELVIIAIFILAIMLPSLFFMRPRMVSAWRSPVAAMIIVFGWWIVNIIIFLAAAPSTTSTFIGYFHSPALAEVDDVAIPSVTCKISPDGRLSATVLIVDTAKQSVALARTPQFFLLWPRWMMREMRIEGLAPHTPYLILRGGEGRAIGLSESDARDPLPGNDLNGHHCHIMWNLVGNPDGHYADGRGVIEDKRPMVKPDRP